MTQTSLPVEQRTRCTGRKRDGSQCSRWARAGEDMCRQHAGRVQPRTPTGLDQDDQARLFAALELGLSLERAVVVAEVSRSTVYAWLQRAKEEGASIEYVAFAAGVEAARARLEARTLEDLSRSRDWRAKSWLLERLFPERYARRPTPGQMKMPEPDERDDAGAASNVIPLRPAGGEADW